MGSKVLSERCYPTKPKEKKPLTTHPSANLSSYEGKSNDFVTCNSGLDIDRLADDEKVVRNVILVGTKLDVVKQVPSKRQVDFQEAKRLAKKLNLSAVLEISSKEEQWTGNGKAITDVASCFMMAALISFEN